MFLIFANTDKQSTVSFRVHRHGGLYLWRDAGPMSEDGELLNRARTFEKIVDIENYEWNHTEKGLGELRQRILNSKFVSVKVLAEAKAEYPTIQQAEDLFKKTFPTWPSDPISDKGKKKLIADYLQLLVDNWFKKWFGEP